ncbi:hypothetical protein [Actinomycetospora succinea]|uniref:hypothetical protein n=1 Tax=Actinomycetospora succinea TaxID=663603 RepID=UPI00105B8AEC|nr:hypothetical protein [Actinomycetospora succinea]
MSLAEVRFLVSLAEPDDIPYLKREPVGLREASLRAIAHLVDNGLMELGDLEALPSTDSRSDDEQRRRPPPVRFRPWPLDNQKALERVRREWWDPERELDPGNICWLQNTPSGDQVAERIEAARGT